MGTGGLWPSRNLGRGAMASASDTGFGPDAGRLRETTEAINADENVIIDGPITATKVIGQIRYDVLVAGAEADTR